MSQAYASSHRCQQLCAFACGGCWRTDRSSPFCLPLAFTGSREGYSNDLLARSAAFPHELADVLGDGLAT